MGRSGTFWRRHFGDDNLAPPFWRCAVLALERFAVGMFWRQPVQISSCNENGTQKIWSK